MEEYTCRGAMTVFFSIITVLFLSLGCAFAESVRMQGARAKAAAVLDMGIFSVFGEYERELLEDYEVFGVDAAYGTGEFQKEHLESRLDEFMSYNTEPTKGIEAAVAGSSLFPISTDGSRVMRILLLTDEDGWVFRDQVVQNIKAALGTELAAGFLEARKKAEELEKAGETYEKQEKAAEEGLKKAEQAQRELEEAQKKAEQAQGEAGAGQFSGDTDGSTEVVIPVNPALPAVPEESSGFDTKDQKDGDSRHCNE